MILIPCTENIFCLYYFDGVFSKNGVWNLSSSDKHLTLSEIVEQNVADQGAYFMTAVTVTQFRYVYVFNRPYIFCF